jgi:hypothetical protein
VLPIVRPQSYQYHLPLGERASPYWERGCLCNDELYDRQQNPAWVDWVTTVVSKAGEQDEDFACNEQGFAIVIEQSRATVPQLRAYLRARGLLAEGNKPALARSIAAAEASDLMMKQGLIQIEAERARCAEKAAHLLGLTAGAYERAVYGPPHAPATATAPLICGGEPRARWTLHPSGP